MLYCQNKKIFLQQSVDFILFANLAGAEFTRLPWKYQDTVVIMTFLLNTSTCPEFCDDICLHEGIKSMLVDKSSSQTFSRHLFIYY